VKPWLVLDTSQPLATVALVEGVRVLAARVLSEQKRHAESLADALDHVLLTAGVDLSSVEGIGAGRGPGSFIGIRTGIAFAKGLALGRGVPLLGLPSLMAIALSADVPVGEGAVVVDGKRGELFVQRVRTDGGGCAPIGDAVALPVSDAPAALAGALQQAAFWVGNVDPAGVTRAPWRRVDGASADGLARALAYRCSGTPPADELDTLAPDYCREADAKLPVNDPGARRSALLGP
jgi:tRNA threonylcarbamoyladenosine biosynthesis protein TsaB